MLAYGLKAQVIEILKAFLMGLVMRIAYFVNKFPVISQTFILNQIIGMLDMGQEVCICSEHIGDDLLSHKEVEKYDLMNKAIFEIPFPKNKFERITKACSLYLFGDNKIYPLQTFNIFKYGLKSINLEYLYKYFSYQDQSQFDIVHAHFGNNGVKVAVLKELGLITGKLITSFHGYDINLHNNIDPVKYYKSLFRKGDIFIANSNNTAKKLESFGCPKEKMRILPVGIDPQEFKPRIRSESAETIIISVGRLVEFKGHKYGIRAVSELIRMNRKVKYLIVGEGYLKDNLKKLITTLKLDENVFLLGAKPKDEVIELLKQASIFLFPSINTRNRASEGQGLVLQEAQSCGLPVVAFDSGAISEGMCNEKTGYLIPEKDVYKMTLVLKKLIDNSVQRMFMVKRGRIFVNVK